MKVDILNETNSKKFQVIYRKSSPGNITHVQEFQTLYFLVGIASEARIEKIVKNI